MAQQKKDLLAVRYLRDVVRHGAGLGVGTAVTVVAWILDKFVTHDWWMHPSTTFYVVAVSAGLAITQFQLWLSSVRNFEERLKKIESEKEDLARDLRKAALSVSLAMKFGPLSNFTAEEQFNHAAAYLEELEEEIGKGNFSRSGEVLSFHEPFVKILRHQFGGGYGFDVWHPRLVKLVEAVDRHLEGR